MAKQAKIIKYTKTMLTIAMISIVSIVTILSIISTYYRSQDRVFFLFGHTISYVVSDSMYPELQKGDVILNEKVTSIDSIKVGDVITYRSETGMTEGKLVTHRVVEVHDSGNTTYLNTKGDANNSIDTEIVVENQIIGVLDSKIRILSFIISAFVNPFAFLILILVPLFALVIIQFRRFIHTIRSK